MLKSVRQLLIAADTTFTTPLSASEFLRPRNQGPLSIERWMSAYGIQRRAYFVRLKSAKALDLLFAPEIQTYEQFVDRLSNESAPMAADEIKALADYLSAHFIFLRFVDPHAQTGVLVGTVDAFSQLTGTPIVETNFIKIRDAAQAARDRGARDYGLGAALIGMGIGVKLLPFVVVGAFFVGMGFGEYTLAAELEGQKGGMPTVTVEPIPPDAEDPSDGGPDSMLDDGSDMPDGVIVGDPPKGVDADTLSNALLDYSIDIGLLDLPTGWDGDHGVELPNFGIPEGPPGEGAGEGIPSELGWASRHKKHA